MLGLSSSFPSNDAQRRGGAQALPFVSVHPTIFTR